MTQALKAETTAPETAPAKDMKDIVALCKRRGFIFPASDIDGGINGDIATCAITLNAIHSVLLANRPGLVTMADIPAVAYSV